MYSIKQLLIPKSTLMQMDIELLLLQMFYYSSSSKIQLSCALFQMGAILKRGGGGGDDLYLFCEQQQTFLHIPGYMFQHVMRTTIRPLHKVKLEIQYWTSSLGSMGPKPSHLSGFLGLPVL
jgi:hypothetical protein